MPRRTGFCVLPPLFPNRFVAVHLEIFHWIARLPGGMCLAEDVCLERVSDIWCVKFRLCFRDIQTIAVLSCCFRLIMRGMCGVLGIIVTQEGTDNRNKSAKVLVANYTSTLDHLAVDLVAPNILVSSFFF